MKVDISYFQECDRSGHFLSLEEKIRELVKANIWPIELVDDFGIVRAVCHNEEELREALKKLGFLKKES